MKFNISDFDFLKEDNFFEIYDILKNAEKAYKEKSPSTTCFFFRQVLELVLKETYNILQIDPQRKPYLDIQNLKCYVPECFYDEEVMDEMTNLRIIGNMYVHMKCSGRDVEKDCLTCLIATQKITRWLHHLKEEYPIYLEREAAAKEQKKNRRKKIIKTAGGIAAGAAAVIGVFVGLKNIFKDR